MLETFILYNDLCVEIEVLKEQLKLTESELEYWFGVKINDPYLDGIPLGAVGVNRFGVAQALEQAEKTVNSINKIRNRLEKLEKSRIKIETLLSNFKGLEQKIAYKRYVEGKTLKDIATEENYSYDYVREVMSRMKKAI